MKAMYKNLAVFVFLVLSLIFLPGCLKDKVTRTYTIYTPVYKTTAEVRSNIKSDVARDIAKPGKLFIRGQYIYLNETDKGIHIIDNSNPSSPRNVAFVAIPGNLDLAVKGNILYADLYTDLVTLDITNPLHAELKSIIPNAFPFRRYPNGFTLDKTKIIVDWQKKILQLLQILQQEGITPGVWFLTWLPPHPLTKPLLLLVWVGLWQGSR